MVGQCFICFTWPDLPKFSELWVPLFSAAAKSGGPRWLDLADFLKGASQRVQVPWVLVLDFPQAQNHWWWALLTCKVAQVPTGQRQQRTNRMNASKKKKLALCWLWWESSFEKPQWFNIELHLVVDSQEVDWKSKKNHPKMSLLCHCYVSNSNTLDPTCPIIQLNILIGLNVHSTLQLVMQAFCFSSTLS